MVEIVSSDARIKTALEKLRDVLLREGAWFHPHMRIVYSDGNFSVHATAPVKNDERAIYIPEHCLIRTPQFSYAFKDGLVAVDFTKDDATENERELIQLIIEIYNLSGKFEQYKRSSVYCLYDQAPHLFATLTRDFKLRAVSYFKDNPVELAFLGAFFDLRTIGTERLLVPFVEYLNHNMRAKIAGRNDASGGMIITTYIPQGSDEFCIDYGLHHDARVVFIYEGFLDRSIQAVKSLPLEFMVEDIKIHIHRSLEMPTADVLSDEIKDLYGYCPYFNCMNENTFEFGFAYIPGTAAPRSLRRILEQALRSKIKDENKVRRIVLEAERKIVVENLDYYKDLKMQLNEYKPNARTATFIANAKDMVDWQLDIIKNYAFFDEAMKARD